MPLTAAAVAGGVNALYSIGTGIAQQIKANKMEKKNIRPTFDIQDEYFQNRDIAASGAQHGLSERALDYARTTSERGLSASLAASAQGGGGVSSFADIYDAYQRSNERTAAQDAELQTAKVANFMQMNNAVAGQKTQKWVIDKYEPYKDTARAIAEMRSSGQQNVRTGISEAGATLSSYATGKNYEELLNNGQGTTGGVPNAPFTSHVDNPYGNTPVFDASGVHPVYRPRITIEGQQGYGVAPELDPSKWRQ
jgi:hypothetical protein